VIGLAARNLQLIPALRSTDLPAKSWLGLQPLAPLIHDQQEGVVEWYCRVPCFDRMTILRAHARSKRMGMGVKELRYSPKLAPEPWIVLLVALYLRSRSSLGTGPGADSITQPQPARPMAPSLTGTSERTWIWEGCFETRWCLVGLCHWRAPQHLTTPHDPPSLFTRLLDTTFRHDQAINTR
jgi:hypothetical protein